MAECSYARCVQQKRNIRRELQRWTRNMVHIVGLERIAEELMGRRKWKLYQESMSRNYLQPLNNNIKRTTSISEDSEYHHHHHHHHVKDKQQENSDQILQDQEEKVDQEAKTAEETINGGVGEEGGKAAGKSGEKDDEHQKENTECEEDAERLKDWTPETKCYFCVDGKLDSEHNTHGVPSPRPSESDSSDSLSDHEVPASLTPTSRGLINNNHHHHRPIVHHAVTASSAATAAPGMTSIENAMALAMAAFSGSGGGAGGPLPAAPQLPFYSPAIAPHWYLARSFQTAAAQAAQAAQQDVDKGGGGGTCAPGEEPLDLSKGGSGGAADHHRTADGRNNQVRLPTPTLDTKHIFNSDFRAKPRMSAVAGRRTYTEDELQAALRDIQSGKLGTRRAAVIYGIPRSTLRNKVYKLALERERESVLNSSTALEEETMDDEKELSGAEEEKEVEKALQAPLLTLADLFRLTGRDQMPDALKSIVHKSSKEGHQQQDIQQLFLAYQNLLVGGGGQKPSPEDETNHHHQQQHHLHRHQHLLHVPDFVKRIITEEQLLKMQQNNNGENEKVTRPSPTNSVIAKIERPRSESDVEAEDSSSNVILKIPSFKPTSSKNGCDIFRSLESTGSLISPPITTDSSNSPPAMPPKSGLYIKDMKDVIAQSISQKLQQEQQQQQQQRRPVLDIEFNRGGFTPPLGTGVSVIRTQQELGRQFQQQQQQQQQHQQQQQQVKPSGSTGGKGTRPKRGKYRNYDRDSLVEAVRAVQRGEMSVHRAGSYYGVPHSTLEYKVKERHLMRPRKRDPKPNPVDEKIASLKQNDLRNPQDKLKQPLMKAPQKFPATSPNGMKLPIFEAPGMAPLGTYNPAPPPPFPFWPHPGFSPLPLDYARNPSAPFPDLFASQMMQKLQEESSRTTLGASPTTASTAAPPTPQALAKTARQMAESLLEAPGTSNGSFLDGIIRSSLESGVPVVHDHHHHHHQHHLQQQQLQQQRAASPAGDADDDLEEEKNNVSQLSNKALLDQLCRNSRLTPLSSRAPEGGSSSGDEATTGRRGSPINFSTGGGGASNEETLDEEDSSSRPDNNGQSIDLSNDSDDNHQLQLQQPQPPPAKQPRIYLKPDLVRPENLKPEMMLVRFRDVLMNGKEEEEGQEEEDNAPEQD